MSQSTPHIYRGFQIRFDELEPINVITMRKSTWAALQQLETGSEEKPKQRYVVKAKPKFIDGKFAEPKFGDDDSEVDSAHETKPEAETRARELKNAGYHTAIIEPTEAESAPLSYGRFRVHSQINATAPFVQDSHFDNPEDAFKRTAELREKDGKNSQIIDSNSGQVVTNVYPGGTAVAGEAPDPDDFPEPDPLPEHPAVENQPPLPV